MALHRTNRKDKKESSAGRTECQRLAAEVGCPPDAMNLNLTCKQTPTSITGSNSGWVIPGPYNKHNISTRHLGNY
jgi:hypothetical protein